MLKTFCANAELRASLQRPGCPDILSECVPIMESCFPDSKSRMSPESLNTPRVPYKYQPADTKGLSLDWDIQQRYEQLTGSRQSKFLAFTRLNIPGLEITARHTSKSNSSVFYQPKGVH